jgi:hypothetical protein
MGVDGLTFVDDTRIEFDSDGIAYDLGEEPGRVLAFALGGAVLHGEVLVKRQL